MWPLPEIENTRSLRALKATEQRLVCGWLKPTSCCKMVTVEVDDALRGQISVKHHHDLMRARQATQ
jgi:hypothetical protein